MRVCSWYVNRLYEEKQVTHKHTTGTTHQTTHDTTRTTRIKVYRALLRACQRVGEELRTFQYRYRDGCEYRCEQRSLCVCARDR